MAKRKVDPDPVAVIKAFTDYVTKGTDREVAIVTASTIEDCLKERISSMLIALPTDDEEANQQVMNDLYTGSLPPLRSGRICADLALAFGFYPPQTYWDIYWLLRIRNEYFAHNP